MIWAITVEALALTLIGTPVEAFGAAWIRAQAQAIFVVPVLTNWAGTFLTLAGARASVKVFVVGAFELSADALTSVETPDLAALAILWCTRALVEVGSKVRGWLSAYSCGDTLAVIKRPEL